MSFTKISISIVLGFMLVACSEGEWEGFVYPDANNISISKNIGKFSSLEECRDEAQATLHAISAFASGDYECGLNCATRNEFGGIKVCDETKR